MNKRPSSAASSVSGAAKVPRRDDMFPDDPVVDDDELAMDKPDEPFFDQDTESIASHAAAGSTTAAATRPPIDSFTSLLGTLVCKPSGSNGSGASTARAMNLTDAEDLRALNGMLHQVEAIDVDESVVSNIESMLKEELPLLLPSKKTLNLWKLLPALRSPANVLDESDPNYQVTCNAYKEMMEAYAKVESMIDQDTRIPEEDDVRLHVSAAKYFKCLLVSNSDMQPKHLRPIVNGRNFVFFDTQSKNLTHLMKRSMSFALNEGYSRYDFADRKNALFKLEGWGVVAVRPKPNDRKYTELHPDCAEFMSQIFRSLCVQRIPELEEKRLLAGEVFFNLVVRKTVPTIQGFDNNKLKSLDKDLQLAHVTINDAYLIPSKSKKEMKMILIVVLYVNYFLTMRGNL